MAEQSPPTGNFSNNNNVRRRFSLLGADALEVDAAQCCAISFDHHEHVVPPRRHSSPLSDLPSLPSIRIGTRLSRHQSAFSRLGEEVFDNDEMNEYFEENESLITKPLVNESSMKKSITVTVPISQSSSEVSTTYMSAIFAGVIISGIIANIAYEKLNIIDAGCGTVFSLLQYLCVILEKIPSFSKFLKQTIIPMRLHLACVILAFVAVMLSNQCLAYDLPFAQYLIIKNSNPVFTIAIGLLTMGKRYRRFQIIGVLLISIGIITCIISQEEDQILTDNSVNGQEGKLQQQQDGSTTRRLGATQFLPFNGIDGYDRNMIGAILCVLSTLAVACLGCTQEFALLKYNIKDGGHGPEELLFYQHFLGIAFFFAPVNSDIASHFGKLMLNWKQALPLGIINVLSVVAGKHLFFSLLEKTSSLTATLATTMCRFLGIVISAFLVSKRNPPSVLFWIGVLTVATGITFYLMASKKTKSHSQKA